MSLAENIYRFRTEQNMSQLDLADALEVSRQSVSKWETGAAVPELDKLIKMSDLFSVSLDALVGRSSPEPDAPVPPSPIPLSGIPPRKIAGAVLLGAALLVFVLFGASRSALEGFLWAIPFVLCGISCFIFSRHTGLWCAWALYLPMSFIPIEQIMRIDIAMMINLFTQIPMLGFTVLSFWTEKLELTRGVRAFLGIGWSAWFLYFAMWLGSLNAPPELFEGFSVGYVVEVLMFPLFAALLTTSFRVRQPKEDAK